MQFDGLLLRTVKTVRRITSDLVVRIVGKKRHRRDGVPKVAAIDEKLGCVAPG